MKKSTLYAALGLILLIALFLGLRLWAHARAVSFVGPAAIRLGANETIYIMSNDFLYLADKEGNLLDKIPASKFGIDHFIGDFWVYKNGDVLLRRASQGLSISGEAELFARTGAGEKDRLGTGESILQRCSIGTFQCKIFGSRGDVFDKITAFDLSVDEGAGITYLSDVNNHQLLMLDDRGHVMKRSSTPFQFPNQIELEDDGLLYVADCNNHRVAAVQTDKDNFGAVVKEFKIVHPRNPLKLTWPMSLAHTPDKKWWVINADDNMSDGIVMILNEKGRFEKIVSLPEDSDPLRLLVVDDRVLVTDPRLMRVYSVSPNGELQDDFGSLSFKLDLSELRRERQGYMLIARVSMWALLVLLVAALLLAKQERVQVAAGAATHANPGVVAGSTTRLESGTRRYDYHSLIGPHRIKFAVITVLLVMAFSFFILISRGLTLFHKEFFPAALLGHFAISFYTYLHLKRSYVEIDERGIAYQGMIRNVQSPWSGVKKISVYGNSSRVVTDYGNFAIGAVEPADGPSVGWLDVFRGKRLAYHKELIEEIQRLAPRVKVNISWLVRYQWKRLPSGAAGPGTPKEKAMNGGLEKSEIEQLDKAWITTSIVWGALIGSLAVYLLAGKLVENQLRPTAIVFSAETIKVVLFGISIATFFITSYIRKTMLKVSGNNSVSLLARNSLNQVQHPAAAKYLSAIIVAMALSESIGIYGLVLFFLSKDSMTLYLFIAMSATAMLYYRPRKEELLQIAVEIKKIQNSVASSNPKSSIAQW